MNRREFGLCMAALATVAIVPPKLPWDAATAENSDALVTILDLFDNVLASGYGKFSTPARGGQIAMDALNLSVERTGLAANCVISTPSISGLLTMPCVCTNSLLVEPTPPNCMTMNHRELNRGDDLVIMPLTLRSEEIERD